MAGANARVHCGPQVLERTRPEPCPNQHTCLLLRIQLACRFAYSVVGKCAVLRYDTTAVPMSVRSKELH